VTLLARRPRNARSRSSHEGRTVKLYEGGVVKRTLAPYVAVRRDASQSFPIPVRTNYGAVEWRHLPGEVRDVTEDDVRRMLLNPFYAIEIAPILAEPHDKMVSEDQWVAANAKLIQEIGAEAWLRGLLTVLKGDFVTGPTGTASDHVPQGNRAQRRRR
jgi:hypothetical protein